MFLFALIPFLAAAAQDQSAPVIVTAYPWAPFISPMGEPFRSRAPDDDPFARWFHQSDRNQDGVLTADEMRADAERFFARLDANHDGRLDFDEWAAKSIGKFTNADHDRSATLDPVEFAATAVKRKDSLPTPCPPASAARDDD